MGNSSITEWIFIRCFLADDCVCDRFVIVSTLTCLCCRFIDSSCTYSTDSILSLSNSSITLQEQKASKCSLCYLQDVLSETCASEIKMVSSGHRASQRSPFPIILALSSSVALWDLVFPSWEMKAQVCWVCGDKRHVGEYLDDRLNNRPHAAAVTGNSQVSFQHSYRKSNKTTTNKITKKQKTSTKWLKITNSY